MAAQQLVKITVTDVRPAGPHGERAARIARRSLATHGRRARIAQLDAADQRRAAWRDLRNAADV